MPSNPNPVWILFRRRIFSRLAYVLRTLGFNLRDHSLNNLLYFIYFCTFWLIWVVAVFALLASALVEAFALIAGTFSSTLATLISAFILAIWGLFKFWQVTGRSPFVFSESDAYLLCQTPVSRQSVGLAWFLMDWFGAAIPFAVGAVLFSFTLTDIALSDTVSFHTLWAYFVSSLRSLVIILPLQMGLQAGLYGLGAMRLRRDYLPRKLFWFWLRLTALPLGLGLLAGLFFPQWRSIILTPLTFPLQAAFGDGLSLIEWLPGAGLAIVTLALGMAILLTWTSRMHLGRAAQETRLVSFVRLARSVMNYELIENIERQSKMKATHSPSHLPIIRSGVWMLVRKNLIQAWRSKRSRQVVRWVSVFFLIPSALLSPSWITQLILFGLWAVSLGSLITNRLRRDLTRWWLLRSLPIKNANLLLSLLGPTWGLGLLLAWLALVLTNPSPPFGFLMAVLLPFLVACATLGSAHDILEHAKAQALMAPSLAEENVPRQGIQGVIIILISVGLPLALLTWGSSHSGEFVYELLSLPVAVVITLLLFRSVLLAYRWIR